MTRPALQFLLVFAALITAVPSTQALRPEIANTNLIEDDLTGSGREAPAKVRCSGISRADAELAALWRKIAAHLRSLARLSQDPAKQMEFLEAAERYEEKARQIEAGGKA